MADSFSRSTRGVRDARDWGLTMRAWSKASGFDDIDLSFRLHRAGYDVFYEPASRVYHRGSSSHGSPCGELLARQSVNLMQQLFPANSEKVSGSLCSLGLVLNLKGNLPEAESEEISSAERAPAGALRSRRRTPAV